MEQVTPIETETTNITNCKLNYIYETGTTKQNTLLSMTKTIPPAKLTVLNWHNQKPNITTVEMLTVLLQ
jgi:hypothetical protein